MTSEEALLWCREYHVRACRKGNRIVLDNVPAGIKVPLGLTKALAAYPGELERLFTSANGVAPAGKDATSHLVKSTSLKVLMQKQFDPRRDFVPGLLVQGVTLFASKAKLGKTWLVLNLALALAYGGHALGKITVERVAVLLLALEDGEQRLQDRFTTLLDDREPPDNLTICTEWPRLDEGGAEQLDSYLMDHPSVKVVFVDTLAKIRPARRKGGDLYAEDYRIGEVLKQVAERHGVAIVLVYHTRKARADDPLDEIRDTVGLTGGVDNCLVMRRERGSADAVLYVSGRDIAEEKGFGLKWDGVAAQWIVVGDAEEFTMSAARRQIIDALAVMPQGLTPTETARKLNKAVSAVKKLMWTMRVEGVLTAIDGKYTFPGNAGNPTECSPLSHEETGLRVGLPSGTRSNRDGIRSDQQILHEVKEKRDDGYPVTTVTDEVPLLFDVETWGWKDVSDG